MRTNGGGLGGGRGGVCVNEGGEAQVKGKRSGLAGPQPWQSAGAV